MTDEPQHEEEAQLSEEEKRRWDELEEEERTRLHAINEHVEDKDAQVNKYQGKTETDNVVNTHAQTNTDRQERRQIDASSVTAGDLQQESNTNTEKLTPEQEAEIAVAEIIDRCERHKPMAYCKKCKYEVTLKVTNRYLEMIQHRNKNNSSLHIERKDQ